MKVEFSYLKDKFKGCMDPGHPIYEGMKEMMTTGDFTLGRAVQEFEKRFAELVGVKHAIGVANGTDALRIGLRLVGVGPGDEVLTAANTFVASAGCAAELFAVPRFVDNGPNFVMDTSKLERAITPKTKAIVPVHFTGEPVEMDEVMHIANKHGIPVVEDSCQSLLAEYKGKCVGTIGHFGTYSLHPLKVLNVFGDGGMLVTNDDNLAATAARYRNHGMIHRDLIEYFGCNSRLDSLQAIVGNYLIRETKETLAKRLQHARYYDKELSQIPGVVVPERRPYAKSCFHLYMIEVDSQVRNGLVQYLNEKGIEAKVHYPIPLQGALELCGFTREDFPRAFQQSERIVTIPTHEHLTDDQLEYVIDQTRLYMHKHARSW